ncbi:hypothetical protein NK6_2390 [Bradyrhizobium diazoefficiens]|uniref:Uncharacterized protein n=1 Tax=Bradyrhizobium diazoefficiens TaxID=1355477 RepID=A0A0E4BM03_9BRAD|nr:hypothetical protein NK6_2390 [Bradyrhizobium diazoefficiens]
MSAFEILAAPPGRSAQLPMPARCRPERPSTRRVPSLPKLLSYPCGSPTRGSGRLPLRLGRGLLGGHFLRRLLPGDRHQHFLLASRYFLRLLGRLGRTPSPRFQKPSPDAKTDGSPAIQREADARNDPIPGALFAGRIIDQHAMDQPAGEVAAVIPDLVALVAGNRKKPRRHSLVLNARRQSFFREENSGRIAPDVGSSLYREVGAAVGSSKALPVTVRPARFFGEDRIREVDRRAGLWNAVGRPPYGLRRNRSGRDSENGHRQSCRFHQTSSFADPHRDIGSEPAASLHTRKSREANYVPRGLILRHRCLSAEKQMRKHHADAFEAGDRWAAANIDRRREYPKARDLRAAAEQPRYMCPLRRKRSAVCRASPAARDRPAPQPVPPRVATNSETLTPPRARLQGDFRSHHKTTRTGFQSYSSAGYPGTATHFGRST